MTLPPPDADAPADAPLTEGALADSALADGDRMECGVCWTVYDPALGDPVWQVAPGTPFAALPEDWRCPHCDAARDRFMRLADAS